LCTATHASHIAIDSNTNISAVGSTGFTKHCDGDGDGGDGGGGGGGVITPQNEGNVCNAISVSPEKLRSQLNQLSAFSSQNVRSRKSAYKF
jgi:hypothetical protein